jgi:hypothetical protein
MAISEELVVFVTVERGVEETLIPGVLASRGIPFVLFDQHPAHQRWYVVIKVPRSRLEDARRALEDAKQVGNSGTGKSISEDDG